MPSILHVISSMRPDTGGPCKHIRDVVPVHRDLGYASEVVCLDDSQETSNFGDSFPIHGLGKGHTSWAFNLRFHSWLKLELSRFDVVVIHGLWHYPGFATWALVKYFNSEKKYPKYFICPHGMLDPWFQKDSSRRLKAIRNRVVWHLFERHIVSSASGLLFTCEDEMILARQTFRSYYPQREINVGYGVARPPLLTSAMVPAFAKICPKTEGEPYFLFLGRIHPKKGLNILIRAYARICSKNSLLKLAVPSLVIAGPGLETPYGRKMRKLASELCPINSVYFPGMLSGEAKWGAIYGCEAFILPSHQENFGIAVVEALACSKPVLISNKINIWREIKDAGAGLVEEDNLEGATRTMDNWLGFSKAERAEFGPKSKKCFEMNFTIESAAASLALAIC